MTIREMHVSFREFAQQMGLQNVRGLLPEQIDLLINTSISDYVNQTIGAHLGLTSDKAIVDNAKVGQLNAFKTLYKRWIINVTRGDEEEEVVAVNGDNITVKIEPKEGNVPEEGQVDQRKAIDVWHFVSFSVTYERTVGDDRWESLEEYKVRLVDEERLSNTLHDALLKPTLISPIGVFCDNQLTVYFGKNHTNANGNLLKSVIRVKEIIASYIKRPKIVSISTSTDCDLPEYTHVDIVKHAVDLFKVSISGALYANQQQAGQNANRRKQQQENESEQ